MRVIKVIKLVAAAAMIAWGCRSILQELEANVGFEPLDVPYTATVAGFIGSSSAQTKAAYVRIQFTGGDAETFTSTRRGRFQVLSVGQDVKILVKRNEGPLPMMKPIYEIDHFLHRYGPLLLAASLLIVGGVLLRHALVSEKPH